MIYARGSSKPTNGTRWKVLCGLTTFILSGGAAKNPYNSTANERDEQATALMAGVAVHAPLFKLWTKGGWGIVPNTVEVFQHVSY